MSVQKSFHLSIKITFLCTFNLNNISNSDRSGFGGGDSNCKLVALAIFIILLDFVCKHSSTFLSVMVMKYVTNKTIMAK